MEETILVNTQIDGKQTTVSISKRKKLKRLIKESLQRNTKLKTNQFLIEEFKYEEQVNHGEHWTDTKIHNAFYVNVEEISSEEGWSTDDLKKIARDIKLYILEYADEKNTTIKIDSFVEFPHDEIIVYIKYEINNYWRE